MNISELEPTPLSQEEGGACYSVGPDPIPVEFASYPEIEISFSRAPALMNGLAPNFDCTVVGSRNGEVLQSLSLISDEDLYAF